MSDPQCGIGFKLTAGDADEGLQNIKGARGAGKGRRGEKPLGKVREGHHGERTTGSEDDRLSRVLHHCARVLVHREKHQGGRASALAVLARHGEMTQAQLAEKLDIRAASVSELIGKMEADGLVLRSPDADDGRAYRLSLTDQEREEAQAVFTERDAFLFEALTSEEKEQLTALLDKLATSWRDHHAPHPSASDHGRGKGRHSHGEGHSSHGSHGRGHGGGPQQRAPRLEHRFQPFPTPTRRRSSGRRA